MMAQKVLLEGNEVIGEAAIRAGCRHYFGYPITPQNELTAYMARRMPEVGGVFLQAESEVAAINMVFGASVAGARAMTSSSSPGISLKQECLSYMAACELPGVVVNICRGGPGLGNIGASQSDYFQATKGGGHGDYKLLVLAPASLQEAYFLVRLAFDLSDKYRTPVLILGDAILGQMKEPVDLEASLPKIKLLPKDWVLNGARSREPRFIRSLIFSEVDLEKLNLKLQAKYRRIEQTEVRVEKRWLEEAKFLVVAYGITARIVGEAIQKARSQGMKVGLIRPITLWPFPYKVITEMAAKVKGVLVVEMNFGQMLEDVKLAVEAQTRVYFYGRAGGMIPTPEEIFKKIETYYYEEKFRST
jgi:2-oxoglutarate ferredoxin oxidoreductase subunit alpha